MGVLVMIAMLGLYIEFNTPGLGLPGLMAVICFVIIIGSKYLIGLANWVEVAVFVVGVLFLLVEVFLLPGFGVAGFLGITFMLAGVFGMLVKNPPEKLPWPETSFDWDVFVDGLAGVSLGFAGFLVLAFLLAKYLPKMQFLSGLILAPAVKARAIPISMTTLPEAEGMPVRVGDVGKVVSPLRPTGQGKFGEAMVNVVAQAEFIEKGIKVEIIEIHGNRVVVKKAE
jgi:membrane-bound serine protease (ClpP class)